MTPSDPLSLKRQIIAYARSLGFERAGVARADRLERESAFFGSWVGSGRAATMDYLKREPAKRGDPGQLLPGVRSILTLAMPYYPGQTSGPRKEGKISRYAWGRDYHKVLGKRLQSLVRYIQAVAPNEKSHLFVDTGPLLERAFAQRAGLGFVGKNTMLITRGLGSWVFLANVLTTLDLPEDAADLRGCGECRICIDACPTGAIEQPYTIDSRKCISYLTIEHRGEVDVSLREQTDGWLYGCDVCQDVCPHNTRVPMASEPAFQAPPPALTLREILEMADEETFRGRLGTTAMTRAGWTGLLRNACYAAVALGRQDLLPSIDCLTRHEHATVAASAAWAAERLRKLSGTPAEGSPTSVSPERSPDAAEGFPTRG